MGKHRALPQAPIDIGELAATNSVADLHAWRERRKTLVREALTESPYLYRRLRNKSLRHDIMQVGVQISVLGREIASRGVSPTVAASLANLMYRDLENCCGRIAKLERECKRTKRKAPTA